MESVVGNNMGPSDSEVKVQNLVNSAVLLSAGLVIACVRNATERCGIPDPLCPAHAWRETRDQFEQTCESTDLGGGRKKGVVLLGIAQQGVA